VSGINQFSSPEKEELINDVRDSEYVSSFVLNPLQTHILQINDQILPLYERADINSRLAQKMHLLMGRFSLACVLIAASLALFQIAFIPVDNIIYIELCVILGSILFLVIDKILGYHHSWLIERHKAERYRFLKYRQIIDPLPLVEFEKQKNEIDNIKTINDIGKWIHHNGLPIDDYSFNPPKNRTEFCSLLSYYTKVRLPYQINFYRSRNDKNKKRKQLLQSVEISLFILIAGLTLVHIGYEKLLDPSFHHYFEEYFHGISIGFFAIFSAALLFIYHAGCKFVRGIFAYPDLIENYQSTLHSLEESQKKILAIQKTICSLNASLNFNNISIPEYQAIMKDYMLLYNCEETMQKEHSTWFSIISLTDVI
jgi:hypothetical protein